MTPGARGTYLAAAHGPGGSRRAPTAPRARAEEGDSPWPAARSAALWHSGRCARPGMSADSHTWEKGKEGPARSVRRGVAAGGEEPNAPWRGRCSPSTPRRHLRYPHCTHCCTALLLDLFFSPKVLSSTACVEEKGENRRGT